MQIAGPTTTAPRALRIMRATMAVIALAVLGAAVLLGSFALLITTPRPTLATLAALPGAVALLVLAGVGAGLLITLALTGRQSRR